jgi:hypothetical protein
MIERKQQPTIEVMPIEITKHPEMNTASGDAEIIGREPLLWYNGLVIPSKYISSFYLDTDGFFPVLKVFFTDHTAIMRNKGFAMDNTIISVYISSRTKATDNSLKLYPIRMDFKIVDYGYMDDAALYFIQGYPNVDGLYLEKTKSFKDKSSYEVVSDISKQLKLGFKSNITGTDDRMTWMNIGMESAYFIQDTTSKAYKSDSSFFTSFIDYDYCLNFVDVEKQMLSDINNQKGIMTASHITMGESESQIKTDLYLTTKNLTQSSMNNVISTYSVVNKSTKISLKNGYRTELHYYDKTGNWEKKAGTFLRFVIETNTDGKGIVLKSFPSDSRADGFFKRNTKKVYMTPLDVDNTHVHYNYAALLNQYNSEEINKVTLTAVLNQPNFNFYRYQKIKVLIFENGLGADVKEAMNERLSGGWLITAINFSYTPEEGLLQHIKMVKRELSSTDFSF